MFRSMTKRGMPKPFAILIAALLALYFVPFNALPASAATSPNFEIDGNQVSNGGEDWASLTPGRDVPDSGGKTNRTLTTFVDNTSQPVQDDTTFGSNNKEDPPAGRSGRAGPGPTAATRPASPTTAGSRPTRTSERRDHVFLVLGFDRGSNSAATRPTTTTSSSTRLRPQTQHTTPTRTAPSATSGSTSTTRQQLVHRHRSSDAGSGDPPGSAAPNAGDYVDQGQRRDDHRPSPRGGPA